jgi:hypothetical protein
MLYATLGNAVWSNYLMLPHIIAGRDWALACAVACGALCGYLWHNVPPSNDKTIVEIVFRLIHEKRSIGFEQ